MYLFFLFFCFNQFSPYFSSEADLDLQVTEGEGGHWEIILAKYLIFCLKIRGGLGPYPRSAIVFTPLSTPDPARKRRLWKTQK